MKKFLAVAVLAGAATAPRAWGHVGHRTVAETAALLVQDDLPATWGPLLARHRFQLGVYAFLPDALYRRIDGASGDIEAPTHYLNLDRLADGDAAGTAPRRAAQFLARAQAQIAPVRVVPGGYREGTAAEGDARRIYLGMVELGVMAHYSGDAAMPYHATSDWNGYSSGQGGIHFFFEGSCVDALEPGLAEDVLASARRNKDRWLRGWGGAEAAPEALVLAVLTDSAAAVAPLAAIDRHKAVVTLAAPASSADAVRKPAAQACRPMRALLVERLAKGAVLTAALWTRALPADAAFEAGAGLQFSDMELAPDYVPPE